MFGMFWIASGSVSQQKHSILIETKPSSSSSFKVNRFHPGPWWTIKLFVQQRSVYNRVIKLCPFKISSFVTKKRRSCAQFHWSRDPRPRHSDNCFHFLKVCEEKRHGDNGGIYLDRWFISSACSCSTSLPADFLLFAGPNLQHFIQ